jgi:KDO2-lipid IV(A) lauroyltransferase
LATLPSRRTLRLAALGKRAADALAGVAAVVILRGMRLFDARRSSAFAGRMLRRIGPLLPENRTGRANLTAAFPEKSPAEIEHILADVWENLGQASAEYAHLDRLWDHDLNNLGGGLIELPADTVERFTRLREDGKPALVFAAHLANWELPAVAATTHGLETTILYRAPSIARVADAIANIRSLKMGTLVPTVPASVFTLARALQHGEHVAVLVDQHFERGVDVTFFGRRCKANPILARLARQIECPIHGVRAIRLSGQRFRIELTPEITPPRDADGRIDVPGTMQAITSVVEGWVREHPEQWLWLHRRWR